MSSETIRLKKKQILYFGKQASTFCRNGSFERKNGGNPMSIREKGNKETLVDNKILHQTEYYNVL